MAILTNLQTLLTKYPNDLKIKHDYGTSGFRNKADLLNHVVFRVGIAAALRSRCTKGIVGTMITASHNPAQDNGIKIIDPSGTMMDESWESIVTDLANVRDQELEATVTKYIEQLSIDTSACSEVWVGCDTRESSPALTTAVIDGVQACGGKINNFGLLSTPQLHYLVRCINTNGQYGEPSEAGYYRKLSTAFSNILNSIAPAEKSTLVVDGANGVGTLKMKQLSSHLKDCLKIEMFQDPSGILNHNCGADFVKVNQREPPSLKLDASKRYVSLDGDADRLIYYYLNQTDHTFHMLDGDKIAVLFAKYWKETLEKAHLGDIPLSIIQTAYANGSSTAYIRDVLQLDVHCVCTGVKHLHHKAEQCQIAIYFEANGHGTMLVADSVVKKIAHSNSVHARQLVQFIDLINQTVGDAISDVLLIEAILACLNITIDEWDSLYTDLPNRLLKLNVQDRKVITTTDAERRVVTPAGLQQAIDAAVALFGHKARSFVRPSGTENVVRIYAEAQTQSQTDRLAKVVANLVYDFAHGVGDKFVI